MEFHNHIKLPAETISVLAIILVLYCLLRWKYNTNKARKMPPEPSSSWPFIGHQHLLGRLPHHITLGELADKYGPIFMINLGVNRTLVVSAGEMAKECLGGTNGNVFANRPIKSFAKLVTYNAAMFGFSQYGQYWRELRKIATIELLSNHRIEMFKDVRISEVRSAIKVLHDNCQMTELSPSGSASVDMSEWLKDLSLNIIVKLISGKTLKEFFQGEEHNRCRKAIEDFFHLLGALVPADAVPFLRWFDIGGYEKEMKRVAKEMDRVPQRWLEEHKKARSSNTAQKNQDFIDVLLSTFETEQKMPSEFDTEIIIKATCMMMILAGAETTSVTLIWTLSLLLNNKDVMNKTRAELDTVVGKERQVNESDLANLVYLQAVLKESMRLYPAGPLSVPRESITDCTVNGYHIPAGTQLFVNIHKIQRDPEVWENPLDFQPERFLTTHKEYDVRGQNYDFLPFGGGRRMCPGISFALRAMQFIIANLVHGFEISTPSDEPVDMTQGFGLSNLKVKPVEVILTRRLPHNLY